MVTKSNGKYVRVPAGTPVARMARAAGIVLLLNLLSRVLGFVRDASIAARFGAGPATDAYLVAYTIPYFLQTILGMAFVTVMVPVVTAYLVRDDRDQGWAVASAVGNWTFLIMTLLAVAGAGLAPWLVQVLAPGFAGTVYALTVKLTRIMFLSLPFMGTGMLISGILNAGYIFTSPALAPAVSNLVIIATVVFAGQTFGITGLAIGTVLSFVAYMAIQLPDLPRLQFRYTWRLLAHHPAVRQIGRHLLPVSLSLAVVQLYLATNRFFASQLVPGSITALDFGNRLVTLPLGIFVASVTTAIFPSLAEQAALQDRREMAHLVDRGLGLVALTILPAAAGLIILREPLVRLVFERGAFDPRATAMTAVAVLFYSLGLLAQAMHPILTRAFYALQDVVVPVTTGLLSVGLNILFSYLLVPYLGHGGLALANSLAASLYALMLYLALYRRLPELKAVTLLGTMLRTGLAALGMGLLVWLAGRSLAVFAWSQPLAGLLIRLTGLIAAGIVTFWGLARLLRIEEVNFISTMLRRRLQRVI
ncbi:Flagellin assembly, membrane protein MviN [Moorella glycerini]|uniref:Probable lipid II flippase MurJ n=1 Tax=Neomoorella stamsii TaxID=1266720 RepID=A0A9X7J3A4_9FIRM|nr:MULTISPECIES: murein biosynthesis integral membrane protein MurJ [Moorella]PRR73752.1 putative peptidoglycan biosynthesis protein MurJ [Moorella stamsii]CEP66302.1 Flagellin assembly, membrane protein MviN [Moorella glycerini]